MKANSNKTGLVLEGGGMRGLFSAGAMDVMMEAGVEFDGVIGVSAGATFGCNYVSRQPGRVLRYNLRLAKDPRYIGIVPLLLTGNIVGPKFAYDTLPRKLDIFDCETFAANPAEFWIVTTGVDDGKPRYHRMDCIDRSEMDWLRASASMPVVSTPVDVGDGRLMLDGGISDSIPLQFFENIGFTRNVVILTQPRDYFKSPAPKWLIRLMRHTSPAIAAAMERRHEMYNAQLRGVDDAAQSGRAIVIAPEAPLKISRTSTCRRKMRQTYLAGRKAAEQALPQIISLSAGAKPRQSVPAARIGS